MRLLSLILCAGIMGLTQAAPITQPLPRDIANLPDNRVVVRTLFFVERTITIPVGSFQIDENTQFILLETDSRHTWTNAVETDHGLGEFKYFFAIDEDIVIYDKRANTPIWYGLAVAATVIAMIGFYIIVKRVTRSPKGESTQGQYPYHDNSR